MANGKSRKLLCTYLMQQTVYFFIILKLKEKKATNIYFLFLIACSCTYPLQMCIRFHYIFYFLHPFSSMGHFKFLNALACYSQGIISRSIFSRILRLSFKLSCKSHRSMNERDQDFTVETKIMTLSIHAYNLLAPNWMAGAHFRFDIRLFFCFIT